MSRSYLMTFGHIPVFLNGDLCNTLKEKTKLFARRLYLFFFFWWRQFFPFIIPRRRTNLLRHPLGIPCHQKIISPALSNDIRPDLGL